MGKTIKKNSKYNNEEKYLQMKKDKIKNRRITKLNKKRAIYEEED
jgi:hypothetical protein